MVAVAALWRLRKLAGPEVLVPLAGLPLLGILSLPASYWLLEVSKSVLTPQLQPMRTVLFVTVAAGFLASVAGIRAAQSGRRLEAFCWLAAAYAVPTSNAIQRILLPDLRDPVILRRVVLVLLLAASAALIAWGHAARRRWASPAWAVALLAPFFLYPLFGRVENYPKADATPIRELAQWARSSTAQDAVFVFPDAGRELYPGVFRSLALRALYVDWKGGGQGNYLEDVAWRWWRRWQAVMAPRFEPGDETRYASLGVDYMVLMKKDRIGGERPVFENSAFVAYRVR